MKKSAAEIELVRGALLAIAASNGGVLSPDAVVEAARDPASPLHDEFEWDDDAAAEAFRMFQAGTLIRRVKLTLVREVGDTKEVKLTSVRAFQSRPSMRHKGGGYEAVAEIMQDGDKRDELLALVLRELSAYRRRYADLVALSQVWNAIDDALAEHDDIGHATATAEARTAA